MKTESPLIGIKDLCALFGKTRAAYYDWKKKTSESTLLEGLVIELVLKLRKEMPKAGVRQLHRALQLDYNIPIGRDYLFDLLRKNHLLIRQRKRKVVTTDSRHWQRKYPNLILEIQPLRANQIWVADITYIRLKNAFAYLSLITDAYSRKIVGYCLHKDLTKEGCLAALQMAIAQRATPHKQLIHHSDRGTQYCSHEYIQVLKTNNIEISMTNNGDPYENAIAERVNGTIKNEFNLYYSIHSIEETKRIVDKSISVYNNIRRHSSCDYLTPAEAHLKEGPLKKHWKNYYKPTLLTHKFEKDFVSTLFRITKHHCQPCPGLIL